MTPGIYRWDELGRLEGNALLVINSGPTADLAVADVIDTLQARLGPSALHVIAPPLWIDRLSAWNLPPERVLSTAACSGSEIEINHALQTSTVMLWTVPKQFGFIIGSDPHSLYNEEVKAIFEQRACPILGDGLFLAHSLPSPYLYAFDAANLLVRAERDTTVTAYQHTVGAFVRDLNETWLKRGQPETNDERDGREAFEIVVAHIPPEVAVFDEARPAPLSAVPLVGNAAIVADLRQQLFERDLGLRHHMGENSRLLAVIEEVRAERVAAVALRDQITDELRAKAVPIHRRLLRWLRTRIS